MKTVKVERLRPGMVLADDGDVVTSVDIDADAADVWIWTRDGALWGDVGGTVEVL